MTAAAKGIVFVELEIHDAENFRAHYMARSTPAVAKYGGRFLVRGGEPPVKTGHLSYRHCMIVEFDSLSRALEFYDSPDYQQPIVFRDQYATVHRYHIMEEAVGGATVCC